MRQSLPPDEEQARQKTPVLLSGTQALVRLVRMQRARDRAAGHDTGGYVSGYRGSPLGAVDMEMERARAELRADDVLFQPALNEDLAATAIWGTQQAHLRGEGRHEGVFGLWYGKGPGVDRSGDALRHANFAGTAPLGGVVMAVGDDHTGESSTTCHQSDFALFDAGIPVLSPAGVQEVLDFGLYGYALSRFAGLWTGLKLMKDTVEVTSVVDASPARMAFHLPDFAMPEGGLNIRLGDHWADQEQRLFELKRPAAEAFARANGMNRRVWGRPGARIGLAAAGKNWLDLTHALHLLGIDAAEAERLGLTTCKIGQTYPLDAAGLRDWAEGLDLIVVVEEKRKLIEMQIKELLFNTRGGLRVWGGTREDDAGRHTLFPERMALDPVTVAEGLGAVLEGEGRGADSLRARLADLRESGEDVPQLAARTPYFCAGCPHSSSTLVPEGSRAYAGIGCHIMAMWMDRETSGYTHMGAEGANWIGEAPFSTRGHVFQNIGDGTYNHSGLMPIRAAAAAGTRITFKILYNDAVAMTGGQGMDGGLDPGRIAHELRAMGVAPIAVVFDPAEEPQRVEFPDGIGWHARDELGLVQARMRDSPGTSAILYVQTCAAEKRRRRRTGAFPQPDKRVFINPEVCEGCGDCGVQSNCVALVPVETELGRKRAVDQSACNADLSCLKGFCPSFVTVEGAEPRRAAATGIETGQLPQPDLSELAGTCNVVIAGVGGTGVVTIGAVLAEAAHLAGKGAAMMEMAGMAQKGGAVQVHCRLAARPGDIDAVRVARGECDLLIGGDLLVAGGAGALDLTQAGRTGAVIDTHERMTGAFTRDRDLALPTAELARLVRSRLGDSAYLLDAGALARDGMGDGIFANMILLGVAWQQGRVPLPLDAMQAAIGRKGERNLGAFALGRWAAVTPEAAADVGASEADVPQGDAARIAYRADHLTRYQGRRLARHYRKRIEAIADPGLRLAVAEGYHKLLAYKDEYEVARLLADTRAQVARAFEGSPRITYHLAPPFLARQGRDGRPVKRAFGPWLARAFPVLARLKWLRGTPFDPFGYTTERRMERRLIAQYERDLEEVVPLMSDATRDAVLELARLPLEIRGFGPVKAKAEATTAKRREELLAAIRGAPVRMAAE